MSVQACLQACCYPEVGQVTGARPMNSSSGFSCCPQAENISMNEFLSRVPAIAVATDESDPAAVRLRGRLRAAAMLAVGTTLPERPDAEALAGARAAAGRGQPLSDIVSNQRTGAPSPIAPLSSSSTQTNWGSIIRSLDAMYVSQLCRVEVAAVRGARRVSTVPARWSLRASPGVELQLVSEFVFG